MMHPTTQFSVKTIMVIFLAIVSIIILSIPTIAYAQEDIKIGRLQIDIWPEYDRPDVLVIYRIVLSPENALPAKMEFRIPLEANKPLNLAAKDADGMLYNLDYTTRIEGDWIWVSFTTPSQEIQLEYYDPRLLKTDLTREFEYRWPGDYTVEETVIQIQEPINTTRMEISPDLGEGVPGNDGLTYYISSIGSLDQNTPFSIQIEYDKTDDTLSSSQVPVFPSEPIGQQTQGRTSLGEVIPWVLGVLGAVMIVGGGFWYWHTGRDIQKTRKKQRQARTLDDEEKTQPETAIYCHKCGKRAADGDLFCRVCGTKLQFE